MSLEVRKITVIISSEDHPVNTAISEWSNKQPKNMVVDIIRDAKQATGEKFLINPSS